MRDVYRVATFVESVSMRGPDERQEILFSYRSVEDRIPLDHPLRAMRQLVDPVLVDLSPRFQALYSGLGAAVDPTRAAAPRPPAPDALLDSE